MKNALVTYRLFVLLFVLITGNCLAQKIDSVQFGIASYYHNKFNGRMTSNGEIFRNDSLTAAHKKLPFGTWVKVTNLTNDSIVIVRINDRLPQSSTRSIDLSQAAARKLNMMRAGIVKAKIEVLPAVPKKVQHTDTALVIRPQDTLIADTDRNFSSGSTANPDTNGLSRGENELMLHDSLEQFEPVPVLKDTVIAKQPVTDNGYTTITYEVIKNGELNLYYAIREPSGKRIYKRNGTIITRKEFREATGSSLP